jgi:hypothetical protein
MDIRPSAIVGAPSHALDVAEALSAERPYRPALLADAT